MKTLKRIHECIQESTELLVPRGQVNIPRHQMPQIAREYYSDFIKFLNLRHVAVVKWLIPANMLRAAQNEINKEKVFKWIHSMPPGAKEKPCIVSADRYIIDGNHTWLAQLNKDPETLINCLQIGLDLIELLNTIKLFDKVTYKTVNESKDSIFWDSPDHPFPLLRNT
jgi:hypothetical protein